MNCETEDFQDVQAEQFNIQPYQFEPLSGPNTARSMSESDSTETESVYESGEENGSRRRNNTDWCSCLHCVPMPSEVESRCCHEYRDLDEKRHELQCITEHDGFVGNCLNPHVIEVSFYEFLHQNGPIGDEEPIHEVYRYIAYRRLARWIWHRLGEKNRRVLPACAVTAIRNRFPSDTYVGFQYGQRDI